MPSGHGHAIALFAVWCAMAGGCGGASPSAVRLASIDAEVRLLLPDAARRLACDPRNVDAELLFEDRASRTYRARGCSIGTDYECSSREDDEGRVRPTCTHVRSGAAVSS